MDFVPDGNFCYIAIHFVDDAVLLGYEYYVARDPGESSGGGTRPQRVFTLRVRRIDRDWFR